MRRQAAFQAHVLAVAKRLADPGDVLGPKQIACAMRLVPTKENCDRVSSCIRMLLKKNEWPYERPCRGNPYPRDQDEPSDTERAAIVARIEEVRREKIARGQEPKRFVMRAHRFWPSNHSRSRILVRERF